MSTQNRQFDIYSLSERAITIEFGHEISAELLHVITGFNELVNNNPFIGFITTVPAYTTLTVYFDPFTVMQSPMLGGNCFEKISNYLRLLKTDLEKASPATGNTVTIPVCYGAEFGPDLTEVATLHQLTNQEVINLHSGGVYKVYMIGFVPGFAYLGGMTEKIATPRKATPRKAIPAGAIGIAGQQTGIYPLETPGGWQIIGRTPLKMFDVNRAQPALLKAGDEVIFKPIDLHEYSYLLAN